MLGKEQAQADRSAALEREEAGGRAGRGIQICGTDEWRGFGTVGNGSFIVVGVGGNGDADLAKIGKTNDAFGLFVSRRESRQQESGQEGNDRDYHEQLDESEGEARLWAKGACV